ncbi:hypothetical protein AVEN_153418-1 [Araneus ventricosus]|uniref:Uncharacterized protein n=1 Tax=Araneus ventricosus TaxID=182803 RepID=A0A4Y2EA61_ARAVE|nr:hypothetical protein AVEN_153418-1 [Araneus ventricosus]
MGDGAYGLNEPLTPLVNQQELVRTWRLMQYAKGFGNCLNWRVTGRCSVNPKKNRTEHSSIQSVRRESIVIVIKSDVLDLSEYPKTIFEIISLDLPMNTVIDKCIEEDG